MFPSYFSKPGDRANVKVMNICWRKFKGLSRGIGTSNWIFSTRWLAQRGRSRATGKYCRFCWREKRQFSTIASISSNIRASKHVHAFNFQLRNKNLRATIPITFVLRPETKKSYIKSDIASILVIHHEIILVINNIVFPIDFCEKLM